MKINNYKVGTKFETLCASRYVREEKPFYDSFGISKEHAQYFGRKSEEIVKVECTIIEEDVIVGDLFKHDSPYDDNKVDYFAWIEFEEDGSYDIRMIYGNIKLYFICFPGGPDVCRFWSSDSYDVMKNVYNHKKGDRRGMTVRLEVKPII